MAKRAAAATTTKRKKRGAAGAKSVPISPLERQSKPYDPKIPSLIAAATASAKKTLAPDPILSSPVPLPSKTLNTISDLKDLASSGMESLKRRLDLCHSEALKEIDASMSRVSKRIKVQTQACLQLTEEAEKEYKKTHDMINESTELVKASYGELIKEAQATASRVCKVSIRELEKSMEKTIEDLRNRFKIPATSA